MVDDRQTLDQSEISAPAFVGREREVTVLGRALARPPAVVLIEAEPGGGKSRLLREYLAGPGRHSRLLVAVCPPFREALTLGPIVDAVRHAADGVAGLRLSEQAGALRPLLPEWADALPALPGRSEDTQVAQERLFHALAELMRALGVTGLVVEDIHWADPVTMEFLGFLAAAASQWQPDPLNLVVTYRSAEIKPESLLPLSAGLPAGTARETITLPPLDADQTARMVSSMLGGERVSVEFARFLHERTGGVPLAVEESVRLLRDRADLARRNGEWIRRRLSDLQVSPTLRDSVLERVQRLSPRAQQVLRAAAVLAEPVSADLLAAVAGPAAAVPSPRVAPPSETSPATPAPATASPALAEAVASGLVLPDDDGRLAFRHAFMAQVVYEAVPGAERRRLHLRAGRALETEEIPPVVQLTRHFREAGEVTKWGEYAERAAARAVDGGDHTTATRLLHDLLSVATLPAPMLSRLARELASNALRRRESVDELHRNVVATLRRIVATAGLPAEEQARIRSLVGRLLAQLGEFTAARSELEQAIPHLRQDSAEAARAMTYLGWPWLGPRPASEHLEWLRRVARIDSAVLSRRDRIVLTADRAAALLQLGEAAGWEVAAQLAADLPEGATDPELQRQLIRTHLNIGNMAMLWGRYGEARQRLMAGLALADGGSYPRLHAQILLSLAELNWATGHWAGLEEEIQRYLEAEDREPLPAFNAACLAGRLSGVNGAYQRAQDQLQRAIAAAHQLGTAEGVLDPVATLGRIWLAEGRAAEVVALTEDPIEPVVSKGIWIFATDIAPVRVEALLAVGRVAEATQLVRAYGVGSAGRDVPAAIAGVTTCRALLAQARGEPAADWYAAAARCWERLPRPYEALLAREREAQALLAAGQIEAGLDRLTDTWRRLSDLGARGDADRVGRRLREHGVEVRRPWRGGRRGYGSKPSPRELEVIRLVLAGKTNREIADALHKSPRTVAGQLASVMRKLGVSSRTELAVRVVEEGLALGDD